MNIFIIPGNIKDDVVRLRPLNILDGPFLKRMMQENDVLSSGGLDTLLSARWIFLWWWLRRRHDLLYIIECESERAGVIGLYNLIPGDTAELSLAIEDKKMRNCGVGSRAFHLLEGALKKSTVIRTAMVRVNKDNQRALSFWDRLGFKEKSVSDDVILLSLSFFQVRERDFPEKIQGLFND